MRAEVVDMDERETFAHISHCGAWWRDVDTREYPDDGDDGDGPQELAEVLCCMYLMRSGYRVVAQDYPLFVTAGHSCDEFVPVVAVAPDGCGVLLDVYVVTEEDRDREPTVEELMGMRERCLTFGLREGEWETLRYDVAYVEFLGGRRAQVRHRVGCVCVGVALGTAGEDEDDE